MRCDNLTFFDDFIDRFGNGCAANRQRTRPLGPHPERNTVCIAMDNFNIADWYTQLV